MPTHWYHGPWQPVTSTELEGFGNAEGFGPPPLMSGLDLRAAADQGTAGAGLFFGPVKPLLMPKGYTHLGVGDWSQISVTAPMRALFRVDGNAPKGRTLDAMLLHLMTELHEAPLLPNRKRGVSLQCGRFKVRRPFRWGEGTHAARVKSVVRKQFAKHMGDASAGRLKDAEHHRRILDMMCEKYGVGDWKEFVDDDRQKDVVGRLQHETTISDDFTGTNDDPIGNQLSWTGIYESTGSFSCQANGVKKTGSSNYDFARADSDLSGDDHSASLRVTSSASGQGPVARMASTSVRTGYCVHNQGNVLYLDKFVNGSRTNLANTAVTFVSGDFYKVECDGSTIKAYVNDVEQLSATDSGITGNVRCGLVQRTSSSARRSDDFESSDLDAGLTLTADGGAVAIAGTAAGLQADRVLVADSGAMSIAGTAAELLIGSTLTADSGSVAIAGTEASLVVSRSLDASAGSVAIAGTDATLSVDGGSLAADPGSVEISGTDAELRVSRLLGSNAGSVAIAGTNADLFKSRGLAAEAGAVSLSGTAAGFLLQRVLSAEAGAIAISGTAVTFSTDAITTGAGRTLAGSIYAHGTKAGEVYRHGTKAGEVYS